MIKNPSNNNFKPCWWLRNAHLQTVGATLLKPRRIKSSPERLALADGDFIDLLWYGDKKHNKGIILLLHGLEGSENSHYIRSAVKIFTKAGYCVVFMFHRGCSSEHNRLARSYHSGETGDMAEVMQHINYKTGQLVHTAVGYSLGANALLKYLGEQGKDALINNAVAVSPPFDLHLACIKLNQAGSRFYQRHLVSRLIRRYQQKNKSRAAPLDVDVPSLNSFLEFDEHITAPLNGFKGAIDYYQKSSCRQFLPNICKPCMIIHAVDDPFLPESAIPSQAEVPECVSLAISKQGGHVGFIGGGYIKPFRWLDRVILSFIKVC